MLHFCRSTARRRQAFTAVLSLVALCAAVGKPAQAWFESGHAQIADIAWTRLTPETKRKVQAILFAGDPKYRPESTSEADVRRAFQKAARFADDIKRDNTTIYETAIEKYNFEFQKDADPFSSDRELNRCKTWHYYDTPVREKPGTHHEPRSSNALVALNKATDELGKLSKANDNLQAQAWWLYWIEHIVGDLHQPLHGSESFEFSDKGDAGGNTFRLDLRRGDRPVNLHAFWDGEIDRAALLDAGNTDPDAQKDRDSVPFETTTAAWTTNATLQPADTDIRNIDPKKWIEEDAKLAETTVYTGITPNTTPSPTYTTRADTLARKEAVLAGYRLAEVLNRTLSGK